MIAIMIVIVVIPIVFGAPVVSIFVPPAVAVIPAVRAGFLKLVAPVLGLRTLPAVVLNGLMQLVVGLFCTLLTILFRVNDSRAREKNHGREHHRRQKESCASHGCTLLIFEGQKPIRAGCFRQGPVPPVYE
jgi:hypothetical protein